MTASHHSFIVGKQLHSNTTLAKGHQFGKHNPFPSDPKLQNYNFMIFLTDGDKNICPCSVFIERFTSEYMCWTKKTQLVMVFGSIGFMVGVFRLTFC